MNLTGLQLHGKQNTTPLQSISNVGIRKVDFDYLTLLAYLSSGHRRWMSSTEFFCFEHFIKIRLKKETTNMKVFRLYQFGVKQIFLKISKNEGNEISVILT